MPEEFDVPHRIALVPDSDGTSGTEVFEIYIKTTPERLWEAITDPEMRAKYSFGVGTELGLDAGLEYKSAVPGGDRHRRGREPGGRSAAPARAELHRALERRGEGEGTSRVTWEISQVGDSCQLTVIHDQLAEDANGELYGGWPMILSGLKTLLETGELLTTPGSLRYSQAANGARNGAAKSPESLS